jgi:4-amino-4-deoxy-L-arabinose transferase-like glycosyltransferase
MSLASETTVARVALRSPSRVRGWAVAERLPRPELAALLVLAGALNLWALGRNGWANDYYSAAVRSMSSSWHNFLFASLDPSGVMTVDKPPLSLWVQALSASVFGYHPLSVLVPQALMGVASVALVYDIVRRRFGRVGAFVAGAALATTPISVAISRHNNPDALLVLCCVAALWCALRGLDPEPTRPRTRWLVLAGVCVGLGFETKMGVALVVVPGIAAAWMWIDPSGRGRLRALRQLLAAGTAMVLVGGAWPLLVELTPASGRPWVAGTSDNKVLSLIFGYNGLNRVGGQAGVPSGAGGNLSGGAPGPLRLLSSALGGQAGWLLGFVLASLVSLLAASRLRRSDARSGWLIALGGAFLVTAVLFSAASGIFHPYYVSLLAPFVAALAGAGVAQLLDGGLGARVLASAAVLAGVAVELVVRSRYPGQLTWLPPLLIGVGALAALALAAFGARRVRALAAGSAALALLIAPGAWALDTLGYATNGTFPSGGPASIDSGFGGGPFGRFGRRLRLPALAGGRTGGLRLFGAGAGAPSAGAQGPMPAEGFGAGTDPGGVGQAGGSRSGPGGVPGTGPGGPPPAGAVGETPPGGAGTGQARGTGAFGRPGGIGGPFGDARSIDAVLGYVKQHGGGTIAVSSQSSAAAAIIAGGAAVAGIGGFSGRESDVSVSWLAAEVRSGKIRWVLAELRTPPTRAAGLRGVPGDTRVGARPAMAAVARACQRVTLPVGAGAAASAGARSLVSSLYDCRGRASELTSTGTGQSGG